MLKLKMLLKGSQFYYHSNTLFYAFVLLCLPQYPVLMGWGGGGVGGLEVLEPDKNDRHATIGGKQRKTV